MSRWLTSSPLESEVSGTPDLFQNSGRLNAAARTRMARCFGEPFFLADWVDVLMCHLEVDRGELQRITPFRVDHFQGRAFVSLVFFTMRNMRPRLGGRCSRLVFRPIATHPFLNVRTYVEHDGEAGIYFISEWLSNRLSVLLGPAIFGLPYRLGRFSGQNRLDEGLLTGEVADARSGEAVRFAGSMDGNTLGPCPAGSLDEWLMERYTAFTHCGGISRYFRVWHPPWLQVTADVRLKDDGLLRRNWPWMESARLVGANYSSGFRDIWMGRPRRLM